MNPNSFNEIGIAIYCFEHENIKIAGTESDIKEMAYLFTEFGSLELAEFGEEILNFFGQLDFEDDRDYEKEFEPEYYIA